jgi:hypothetical protein
MLPVIDCLNGYSGLNPSVPQGGAPRPHAPARPDSGNDGQDVRALALYDGLLHCRSGAGRTLDA